jgi:hypothetical protein
VIGSPLDESAVRSWTVRSVGRRGWRIEGFACFRHRPWSTVYRAERLGGGALWVKAEATRRNPEREVLLLLAQRASLRVPEVLDADANAGLLLLADEGDVQPTLSHDRWQELLRQYGALQQASVQLVDQLVQAGVPDLRPESLTGAHDALVREVAELEGVTPLQGEVDVRRRLLQQWTAELAQDGVASAVQHDDLHAGNVAVRTVGSGDAFALLDWGDASVAHPYASLTYPLQLAERGPVKMDAAGDVDRVELLKAYLEGRDEQLDEASLRSVYLAGRLAAVGRARAWSRVAALPGASEHKNYYRTGVERWLRRLEG